MGMSEIRSRTSASLRSAEPVLLAIMAVREGLDRRDDAYDAEVVVDVMFFALHGHPPTSTIDREDRVLHPALAGMKPATGGT